MKPYTLALVFSAILAIPETGTAQTLNLSRQEIHEVARGVLGSFPQDPNERKALAQQLEAINAEGQRVIECHYGMPGQIYSYAFWHKSAPDGIRQILKSLRSGNEHPFATLGVNAIDVCPGTREAARKLLADSRAGVESTSSRVAASAKPAPAGAAASRSGPSSPVSGRGVQVSAFCGDLERGYERGTLLNPFLAYPKEVIDAIFTLATITPRDIVYDIGWGDGSVATAAATAKVGARGVAIPLCPKGFAQGTRNAASAGVAGRVKVLNQDVFQTDMRDATVVILYWLPSPLEELRPKLERELRAGARIVSASHVFGVCVPSEKTVKLGGGPIGTLHFWTIPLKKTC